eukprot:5021953-Amphidinium_carterae.1
MSFPATKTAKKHLRNCSQSINSKLLPKNQARTNTPVNKGCLRVLRVFEGYEAGLLEGFSGVFEGDEGGYEGGFEEGLRGIGNGLSLIHISEPTRPRLI